MNTITIYTTTDDLFNKIALLSLLESITSTSQVENIKGMYKPFNVYLTNKPQNRVAFNLNYSTLSLLAIFIGGNLLTD